MKEIPEARLVTVFKSRVRTGAYIFVPKEAGAAAIPDGLLTVFGHPEEVISMRLSADRRLANADAEAVLAALQEQGYYLQLPPDHPGVVA